MSATIIGATNDIMGTVKGFWVYGSDRNPRVDEASVEEARMMRQEQASMRDTDPAVEQFRKECELFLSPPETYQELAAITDEWHLHDGAGIPTAPTGKRKAWLQSKLQDVGWTELAEIDTVVRRLKKDLQEFDDSVDAQEDEIAASDKPNVHWADMMSLEPVKFCGAVRNWVDRETVHCIVELLNKHVLDSRKHRCFSHVARSDVARSDGGVERTRRAAATACMARLALIHDPTGRWNDSDSHDFGDGSSGDNDGSSSSDAASEPEYTVELHRANATISSERQSGRVRGSVQLMNI